MGIKRIFYICSFLGTLGISLIPQAVGASESGNPPDSMNTRKIVKIQVQSQEEINELGNIVAPWEVHEDYIITDVTEKVMQQIMDKGFPMEVLFESLEEFMTFYGRPLPQAGPEGLYHSYSAIEYELQQLALAYPQIAKVYDIGDSWEKTRGMADRDIWAKIGIILKVVCSPHRLIEDRYFETVQVGIFENMVQKGYICPGTGPPPTRRPEINTRIPTPFEMSVYNRFIPIVVLT
jgi:hypothetical protein